MEIGRIAVPDPPRQKVSETPSQPIKRSIIVCSCQHSSADDIKQEAHSPGQTGEKKSETLFDK
jgi:hypothetical protein